MVAMVSSSKAGSPGKTFVVAGSLTCERLTRFSWSSRTGGAVAAVAAWAVRLDSAAPNTPASPAASTLRLIGMGTTFHRYTARAVCLHGDITRATRGQGAERGWAHERRHRRPRRRRHPRPRGHPGRPRRAGGGVFAAGTPAGDRGLGHDRARDRRGRELGRPAGPRGPGPRVRRG